MLPRTLEPEAMDSPEEALAYDRMDHGEVNRRFVDDLLAAGPDLSQVLDLGTGTAQIPVALCRRMPEARVVAVDLAVSMLDVALANIEAAGLREAIRLDRVDAKQLPYPDGAFACVMSNSIVHHVPDPLRVLREAWRVVRPGGVIFFRDLLRPASRAEVDRLVALYAGDCDEYQQTLFADSLCAALTLPEMRQLVGQLPADPQTVQQTSDRHWTWVARKPPSN